MVVSTQPLEVYIYELEHRAVPAPPEIVDELRTLIPTLEDGTWLTQLVSVLDKLRRLNDTYKLGTSATDKDKSLLASSLINGHLNQLVSNCLKGAQTTPDPRPRLNLKPLEDYIGTIGTDPLQKQPVLLLQLLLQSWKLNPENWKESARACWRQLQNLNIQLSAEGQNTSIVDSLLAGEYASLVMKCATGLVKDSSLAGLGTTGTCEVSTIHTQP